MDREGPEQGIGEQAWREPDAVEPLPLVYLPGEPDLVRELIWRRGFHDQDSANLFMHPQLVRLPESAAYPGLTRAADRIDRALSAGERICVWGDFDADGQTATALLVEALRSLGAETLYYIPSRITEGHGLHIAGLQAQAAAGCSLVITCDCGTNDCAQVAFAGELGIDVVVTDHHQQSLPEPRASAIWNSSAGGQEGALNGLCGVATAYMLVRELMSRRGDPLAALQWLDIVALGTVADLAPPTLVNRALLARGLPRLWKGSRPGIRSLLALSGGPPADKYDTAKISYKLSPMLNAAGRMGDACVGVALLLAREAGAAAALASQLDVLNQERQRLAEELEREIDQMTGSEAPNGQPMLVVGDNWHSGLLGSAATRYSARLGKTAVIISRYGSGMLARGSVRGHGDQNVLTLLKAHAHLLHEFGGHTGAAGFSLERENVDALLSALREADSVQTRREAAALAIDAIIPWACVDPLSTDPSSLSGMTRRLAPFSHGNPEPVFASKELTMVSRRAFGKRDAHADLVFADRSGNTRAVRWWRHDPDWRGSGRFDVAYTISDDTFRGVTRPRLTLVSARPSAVQTEK